MKPHPDFREEQLPRPRPGESRGILEPRLRLAAEHGNDPGIPAELFVQVRRVSDPRAVWRKHRMHLGHIVVCELNWLAVWQDLDVDLAWPNEGRRTSHER